MRFEKWQALGNDYVVLELDNLPFELTPGRIRRICEPHAGVGCDGILLMARAAGGSVAGTLEIYNPDGSRAELSGNGARQAILYARTHAWSATGPLALQTDAGVVTAEITGKRTCRVDMGRASTASKDFPSGAPDGVGELSLDGAGKSRADGAGGSAGNHEPVRFQHVSIGNPQCAIAIADLASLAALDLPTLGPPIEANALFPNRTNVSWHAERTPPRAAEPARISARIFERGVGETLSSGTGATGAAIAYLLRTQGNAESWPVVVVELDGGELTVEVDRDTMQVHLSGWAVPVFAGSFSDELMGELSETQ